MMKESGEQTGFIINNLKYRSRCTRCRCNPPKCTRSNSTFSKLSYILISQKIPNENYLISKFYFENFRNFIIDSTLQIEFIMHAGYLMFHIIENVSIFPRFDYLVEQLSACQINSIFQSTIIFQLFNNSKLINYKISKIFNWKFVDKSCTPKN